jgi:hypothetical protein
MSIVGFVLLAIGGIAAFITGIMILIEAFKESLLWGLGSLLVPFVILVFVLTHWSETGKLFLYNIAATVAMGVGVALAGVGAENIPM